MSLIESKEDATTHYLNRKQEETQALNQKRKVEVHPPSDRRIYLIWSGAGGYNHKVVCGHNAVIAKRKKEPLLVIDELGKVRETLVSIPSLFI